MKNIRRFLNIKIYFSLIIFTATQHAFSQSQEMTMWFSSPASDWEQEGLPIGNGTMGAVITGGIQTEKLQFNEKTLWEGGPGSKHGYDFGHPTQDKTYLKRLAAVQKELEEKGVLKPKEVASQLGRTIIGYGNYQSFGDIALSYSLTGKAKNYRRSLDLSTAIGNVSFDIGKVHYNRKYFASYPDGVIAVHLTANKPGQQNLSITLEPSPGRTIKRRISGNTIIVSGEQDENTLAYEAQLAVIPAGGRLQKKGDSLVIKNADSVLLLLVAGTNYAQQYPSYRGIMPHQRLTQTLQTAAGKTANKLLNAHMRDHKALFNRMQLDLAGQMPDKPINTLLKEYKGNNTKQDLALEALYFQLGRYLLIASSRPGSLPANLQGVWNHSNTPPWNADYHVNINLQMNYWPADVTNLAETNIPLLDFIDSLITPGTIAAKKILGAKQGWTLFLNTNIYGFTGVIKWPTAFWQPEAGAWLAQHYYEHYLFSGDKRFLSDRAYPAMKGAAQCWLDVLVKDKRDGALVVNPSYSPEHGGFTVGAAMSQQLVYDLLRNTYEAARIVKDLKFAKRVKRTLSNLDTGTRIGKWGQLQEWKTDSDDPENKHRHISHLFALHPGRQISPIATPTLAEAAKTTLNSRGDAGTGWSKAWKINLWARLLDGNRSHKLLAEQLIHSTLPNLWDNHPPFQIDGNFGATAGIAEMLIQSHNNEIHLLPALPNAWATGKATGLKARGNTEVDITWEKHQMTNAVITSMFSQELRIRLKNTIQSLTVTTLSSKQTKTLRVKNGVVKLNAKKNEQYSLNL